MSYLGNILIAIDQLGNTIAGGNPDCTISGRVGYYSEHASVITKWYWLMLRTIVNFTFYPLDGPDHCHYAYHSEEGEAYIEPKGFLVFIFSIITMIACILLIPIFYLLLWIRLVSPKRDSNYKHIKPTT